MLSEQLREWADALEAGRTPLAAIVAGMREVADDLSLSAADEGDECPLCNSGTVEHREGEVRCKGECGSTAQMAHIVGGVVAMVGNLSDGFHAVGPFTDMDYAIYRMAGKECWLMTLNSNPDYLERRQGQDERKERP